MFSHLFCNYPQEEIMLKLFTIASRTLYCMSRISTATHISYFCWYLYTISCALPLNLENLCLCNGISTLYCSLPLNCRFKCSLFCTLILLLVIKQEEHLTYCTIFSFMIFSSLLDNRSH